MSRTLVGRELDVLVAEQVLGWTRPVFQGQDPKSLWDDRAIYDAMISGGFTHTNAGKIVRVPSFSTDLAAAWQVVTYLERLPDPWMLTLKNWNYYGDRTWTAEFTSHPLGPPAVEVRAATVPLAICLAALQATETRVKSPQF